VPERPKAVLFDLGEVVLRIKTDQLLASIRAASPRLDEATMLAELRNEGSRHHAYERGEISGQDFHAHLQSAYGMTWTYGEWLRHWNDYFLPNRPMDILLAKLRGQAPLWALSNTNPEHYRHVRREYRVFDAFEGIITSYEAGLRKPDPRIYQLALDRMGRQAHEVVFIDDLEANIAAARGLGLLAFHYTFNDLELKAYLKGLGFTIPEWESRPSSAAC
jgi:HAD superfamily hydrolase (TIGR01509 family)